jgi:uncharacterized protein YndB with AHSA1/START domain
MDGSITLATEVPAEPARVFEILTSSEGQRATWTGDCEVTDRHARFGFPGAPVDLRADVVTDPGRKVRMEVTQGFPFWEHSAWEWELQPSTRTEGGTTVLFRHTGLDAEYPELGFAECAQTWAHILDRLARFAENGVAQPVFPPVPA